MSIKIKNKKKYKTNRLDQCYHSKKVFAELEKKINIIVIG